MILHGMQVKRICELQVGEEFIFAGVNRKVVRIDNGVMYYATYHFETKRFNASGNGIDSGSLMAGSKMFVQILNPNADVPTTNVPDQIHRRDTPSDAPVPEGAGLRGDGQREEQSVYRNSQVSNNTWPHGVSDIRKPENL